METDTKTIVEAARMVRRTRKLKAALREWFGRKKGRPDPEVFNFEDWVCLRLRDMAREIQDEWIASVPGFLVKALEVQTVGVPLADREAECARRGKCRAETCCYVEEGNVYASVWVRGRKKAARVMADLIAVPFREAGYDVEVLGGDDETEATCLAFMPFPAYLELQKKKGVR